MSDKYEDLNEFKDRLGKNDDFYPDEADLSRLVDGLNDRIDAAEKSKVTPVWWHKYATTAAAVLLLVSVYLAGRYTAPNDIGDTSIIYDYDWTLASTTDAELALAMESDTLLEFNDSEIEILLHDYTITGDHEAAGNLLEGLTEEELSYLQGNFDFGEIL